MNSFITIDGFEDMSAQEIFDISAGHLLGQMRKSQDEEGTCRYRGPEGLMCAAGPFLDGNKISPGKLVEGMSWLSLLSLGHVPEEHADLVSRLQAIHDGHMPRLWHKLLRKEAKRMGIEFRY